jgi:DNA-directed RNA polymerase specialized sigma24 family protein
MPPPPGTETGVKPPLTRRRRRRPAENDEYAAFVRRVLRAYSRRIARGDIDAIADLSTIAAELDGVMREAVGGLRGAGYSWAEIADRLGVTRQAVHQRWGGSRQK